MLSSKKVLGAVALAGFATLGHAVELYNNGAVVNGSGLSIVAAPDTTLGVTASIANGFYLADNFTVTGAGWNVASLDFYAYQTSAVGFTFTNVAYSIVKGTDVNTGTVVASGTVAALNDGFVGYRVISTATTGTTRAIYKIGADIPDITLSAGSYFVTWALGGTGASGPFAPPVVGSTTTGTGNALQGGSTTSFVTVVDGGSGATFELPFSIAGTVVAVPEPETYAMLMAGLGVLGFAARNGRRT